MGVLLVNGFAADSAPEVQVAHQILVAKNHDVTVCHLASQGFDAFMSADERRAYHSDAPLITPETRQAADQLLSAEGLVIVYPATHGSFPARVKSWNERVFVPGVAFRFKPSGVVTGALDHLRRATVIAAYPPGSRLDVRTRMRERARAAPGPSLARSFTLSSNRKCRSRFRVTASFTATTATHALRHW